MLGVSNKTYLRLRSQTLGQLSSRTRGLHEYSLLAHIHNIALAQLQMTFMHDQRMTPFILHSSLHLCLIICNLCSTTIHLTKYLSVTLLKMEVPQCKQAAVWSLPAGAGFSTRAALLSWLTPRTGCSAGTRNSRLWVSFLNAKTLREKQLYFPQTDRLLLPQARDWPIGYSSVWLLIKYWVFWINLSLSKAHLTCWSKTKLRCSINMNLQNRLFFLKQSSPQNVQRSMDLNVIWHLYLQVHFRKDISVINLVWVIKVCLHLEIYQNNF